MKLKIKVKEHVKGCMPTLTKNGDWIDLHLAENVNLSAPIAKTVHTNNGTKKTNVQFDTRLISLGVAIELPAGYEAVIVARSSLPKHGVFLTNNVGVIDNCYKGDSDVWRLWLTALQNTNFKIEDRLCQFRVQLSQKATLWQRIKNIFYNGVEIVRVDSLGDKARGGIGTSGLA